jgi:hypothetical protein
MQVLNLNDISDDFFTLVWEHLTVKDIVHLSETSRLFRLISIRVNKLVTRQLNLPSYSEISVMKKETFLQNMISFFTNISKLTLHTYTGVTGSGSSLHVLYKNILICESLMELTIQVSRTEGNEFDELKQLYNLKSLNLSGSLLIPNSQFILSKISNLTSLTHLDLSLCTILHFTLLSSLSTLSNLKSLNLNWINYDKDYHKNDENFELENESTKVFSFLTNLTHLNLRGPIFYSEMILFSQLSFLTNLTTLDMSGSQVTGVGFTLIDTVFTNLSSCIFQSCNDFHRIGLHNLCALHSITYLDLSHCWRFSDDIEGMSSIYSLKHSLNSLNIADCNFSDDVFEYLSSLTNLTSLNISDNYVSLYVSGRHNISSLTSLTYLNISRNNLSDIGLIYLSCLTSLTSLDISRNEISNNGILSLLTLQKINILKINYCEDVSDMGLYNISDLKNITSLDLFACTNITCHGISKLLNSLINLQHLDLGFCDMIIDNDLFEITYLFVNIKKLKVTWRRWENISFTYEWLSEICKLKNLKEFEICHPAFILIYDFDLSENILDKLISLRDYNLSGASFQRVSGIKGLAYAQSQWEKKKFFG